MLLTPQQTELASILEDRLIRPDRRTLIVEGFSGVGKSTLLETVLGKLRMSRVHVGEFVETRELEAVPPADVAVVDYRDPEQVELIRASLQDRMGRMVLLAHPRLTRELESKRVDHVADLAVVGVPADLHCLDPMRVDEVRRYIAEIGAEDPKHLVEDYSLGLRGHIQTLLADPLLTPERAEVLTGSKVFQVLAHARVRDSYGHTYARARQLGLDVPSSVLPHLNGFYNSLEKWLARVDSRLDARLPVHRETLELYREICAEGCTVVRIYVPNLEDSVLVEFGLEEDGELSRSGWLLQMCHTDGKAGILTQSRSSHYFRGNPSNGMWFRQWLKGRGPESAYPPGANPAFITASAHGGSNFLDTPLFPYAVETGLQSKGIPYFSEYFFWEPNKLPIRHQVSAEGLRVL